MYFTGVGSFLFSSSSIKNIPHFNCTLTTSVRNYLHFPLKLLPVLTGTVLILVDVSVLCLALVIKSCGCGRLAVTWYLSVATCTATWTVWCALYLNTLAPHWLQDRRTCNDMVVGVVLVGAGLVCLVTLIYLAISLVVLVYECCGSKRQQQRDVVGQHTL